MNDAEGFGFNDPDRLKQNAEQPHPRAVGSPLPMGAAGRAPCRRARTIRSVLFLSLQGAPWPTHRPLGPNNHPAFSAP